MKGIEFEDLKKSEVLGFIVAVRKIAGCATLLYNENTDAAPEQKEIIFKVQNQLTTDLGIQAEALIDFLLNTSRS